MSATLPRRFAALSVLVREVQLDSKSLMSAPGTRDPQSLQVQNLPIVGEVRRQGGYPLASIRGEREVF